MPVHCRRLAVLGWVFYLLSWITPGTGDGRIAGWAFIAAAGYGVRFLFLSGTLSGVVLGLALLVGWLANFSIFIPLSIRTRWVWILAPWVAYAAVLLLLHAPVPISQRAMSLLYF